MRSDDPLRIEDLGEEEPRAQAQPHLANARYRERSHRPRSSEPIDVEKCVQNSHRQHPVRVVDRPLEADRPADVVHHQMHPVKPERVDRLTRPRRKSRPRVVERSRPVRQAQSREVERRTAQPLVRQHRKHPSVEERGRRHAVEQHHVRALALLARECPHPARLEPHPGGRMPRDRVVYVPVDLAQPAWRPDVSARHVHLANRRHGSHHVTRNVRIRHCGTPEPLLLSICRFL